MAPTSTIWILEFYEKELRAFFRHSFVLRFRKALFIYELWKSLGSASVSIALNLLCHFKLQSLRTRENIKDNSVKVLFDASNRLQSQNFGFTTATESNFFQCSQIYCYEVDDRFQHTVILLLG
jgi:hypothetical protein